MLKRCTLVTGHSKYTLNTTCRCLSGHIRLIVPRDNRQEGVTAVTAASDIVSRKIWICFYTIVAGKKHTWNPDVIN